MGRADHGLRTVRTKGYIRKLRRAVAADAISRDSLESKVQFLRNHWNTQVGPEPTARSCIFKCPD